MNVRQTYIEILKSALRRANETGYEQVIAYNSETQEFDCFATADQRCFLGYGFEVIESVSGEASHCGVYVEGELIESAIDALIDDWYVISLIR